MSNSYANNITRLCELAFRAYARDCGLANIPVARILAGFDGEEKIPTPRLVFNCDHAEPDGHPDDGNWACHLEIQCASNCDDRTQEQHHDFASEVFSQFMAGRYTVPDLITAAAAGANPVVPFICWDLLPGRQAKHIHDRHWLSSMEFRVVCCGTAGTGGAIAPILEEGGGQILTEDGGVLVGET